MSRYDYREYAVPIQVPPEQAEGINREFHEWRRRRLKELDEKVFAGVDMAVPGLDFSGYMPIAGLGEHLFGPYDAVCSKCGMTREQSEEEGCG